MAKMLILGRGGSINTERVIAVANAKSTPIRTLVAATEENRILNLTFGYPRRAVIVLDNGYLVLSSRTPDELARALVTCEALSDEDQPPWW